MPKPAITSANISEKLERPAPETRTARRKRLKAAALSEHDAQSELLRRQIAQIREKIFRIACSSAWAEDCMYRGTEYAPDFHCRCGLCESKFPHRLYPRHSRESRFSIDCQVEVDEDPEFAEEFARLRNDRVRIGSVFLAIQRPERHSEGGIRKGGRKDSFFSIQSRRGKNS
jgi:hypothetical protein